MSKSPKLPLLTDKNFLEWKFKVSAVLDGLGLLKILNGGKPWDANGKFIAIDPNVKTSAMALLAPLFHTVIASGGDTDPVVLWENINAFGSLKKEANLFRAYGNLEAIVIDPNNLAGTILKYCDPIGELKSLGCTPDERQTAHSILKKIPSSLASIRDSIISTGQTSTVVTYDLVLNMLDNKAKTLSISAPLFKPSASFKVKNSESDAATALLTYKCKTDDMIPRPTMLRDNAFPSTLTS
ncbi:hypothetical protein MJO28_007845 [Puccinia striiformis f. sp. tritici]|uniref:Uncharacterized protein n=1 Tax=Puccinia striiformis f. sp. tritici TaxID=168172 RepID=A0ACC0EFR1_9BASI|nr:hypothetical protein MJO28_007845 [Puccinia striiformis f. sp. tritici]